MRAFLKPLALFAALLAPVAATQAAIHKCEVDGAVRYQQSPCPSDGTGARPTVESLNAERQKKLQAERLQGGSAAAAGNRAGAMPVTGSTPVQGDGPAPAAAPAYRCDGRLYCSQMTSCAEAKWFLNHCPGVKMDGNHDGRPCEQQWCTR